METHTIFIPTNHIAGIMVPPSVAPCLMVTPIILLELWSHQAEHPVLWSHQSNCMTYGPTKRSTLSYGQNVGFRVTPIRSWHSNLKLMSISHFSINTSQRSIRAANIELTVEKSKFNETTFIHLSKNNRYICFSSNVWKKLSNQFHHVTEALKNEQNFKFKLTKESNLETLPFYGKMYVCFKRNNLYINLDKNQWKEFQEKALEIFSLENKENIPPEPTVTKYLYSVEQWSPKSFFSKTSLKQYAEQEGWPYTITEKKVPAPDKQKLVRLVRAYMTHKTASDLVREHCYGCQYDMPGQRDHSCLEEDTE